MFDACQTINAGPKCSEVAEKLVQLFGWRHTYNVEKLQRNVRGRSTTRISITKPTSQKWCPAKVKSGPATWVSVHNLQTQGGGILDPDDKLCDVVDDREQILATFEDGDGPHHGGGDGASGSSVGTGSPDIFHDGDKYGSTYPQTDIEVTGEQIANGIPGSLQVRRGSEPALNQLPPGPPLPTADNTKRWSAAPLISEPPPSLGYNGHYIEDEDSTGFRRMQRDGSNRLSMQFFEDGAGFRWADAAERAKARAHTSTSLPREHKRKEPLGQANNSTSPVPSMDQSELIVIRNEPGPLGIHVVPDYDIYGKDRGLLVQGIEPGGRIDRDGRLAINDRIIEINGQNLLNMPFQRVQDMFKLSLTSSELRLKVVKDYTLNGIKKQLSCHRFAEDKDSSMVEFEQKRKYTPNTKVATVSPTKKLPTGSKNLKTLLTANTRKIGRKIEIELTKGPHGLGFSITTRDNPAGGNCPIYIKNIIPKGAAVEDGRLKIGDRLLEVNGVEMTGKSQSEAVAVLRNAPPGSKVKIVVSRQEDVVDTENELPRIIESEAQKSTGEAVEVPSRSSDTPPTIPPLPQSHLQALQNRTPERGGTVAKIVSQFQDTSTAFNPPEKLDDSMIFPWKHREVLTFNIPVHDTEKAGLGISVKGKTSGNQDLGIFIKSVINGGAASRDKRLQTNDQLLNVNGISLLQQSNSDAMETLRKAMLHTEGPVPGNITLTIARRASSPPPVNRNYSVSSSSSNPNLLNSNEGSEIFQSSDSSDPSKNNSGASNGSTNTVIYNPYIHSRENSQSHNLNPIQNWNPVIDRLVGNNNKNSQLRNESYYKATHDTWSSSMLANNQSFDSHHSTTTVSLNGGEPILIEDEYGSRVLNQQSTRINVHMTNKMNLSNGSIPESRKDHEPDGKASLNSVTCDNRSTESSQTTIQSGTDATYASQLSLENPKGFSRDAFGRQSMSEKRHATLDAKSTDTYQRTKKLREQRTKEKDSNLVRVGSVESVMSVTRTSEHPEYADKLGQLGPSLGMKKSSSLESLQTMVQEIQMQEEGDPAYSYRGPSGALKVIRGRGCEESFRAAVDDRIVDPNHRSEKSPKKHWLLDPPTDSDKEIEGFNNVRGGPRQSSLNAALDNKHKSAKKKPSILKGIGSMFRFGKHRKVDFPNVDPHYHHSSEFDNSSIQNAEPSEDQSSSHSSGQQKQPEGHQGHPSERTHEQQDKSQQLQQQQQQQQQHMIRQQQGNVQANNREGQQGNIGQPLYQRHFVHRHAEQVQVIPENSVAPPVKYRNNGEVQRRSDRKLHEQRQAARHSYYPPDERENLYEHRQLRNEPTYGEYGRPGSRTAVTDSVPFTHYVNYNELQSHLSNRKEPLSDSQIVQMRLQVQQQRLKVEEESRKQHQYHSQRQTKADSQIRPMSNFYEYESVQSILSNRGRSNAPAQYAKQSSSGHHFQDMNSNSLPRNQQGQLPQTRGSQRGPFVTQVTIGEQNGTKV
ncbi:partitioning defective 3 homolog isoform X3 [Coccinella septempunctata]|uniref:partitioning defective 3 homolog isoform X3 n=1 Tax=Coccinella septempunctata TaxID=41139 RepID=UPI001D05E679|nr:partitioning defective 3 homolog isoform X3 [Coccinella septempunctata]